MLPSWSICFHVKKLIKSKFSDFDISLFWTKNDPSYGSVTHGARPSLEGALVLPAEKVLTQGGRTSITPPLGDVGGGASFSVDVT